MLISSRFSTTKKQKQNSIFLKKKNYVYVVFKLFFIILSSLWKAFFFAFTLCVIDFFHNVRAQSACENKKYYFWCLYITILINVAVSLKKVIDEIPKASQRS